MNRRSALSLFAGIAITGVGMKCSGSVQGCSEDEHVKWVEHSLEQMLQVKRGMKRSDLLSVFTAQGGLSEVLQQTYVSLNCPYFKVDVRFRAFARPSGDKDCPVNFEDPRDKIVSISRPYLEFPGPMD